MTTTNDPRPATAADPSPPARGRVRLWRLVALVVPLLLFAPWVDGCNEDISGIGVIHIGGELAWEVASDPPKAVAESFDKGLDGPITGALGALGLPLLGVAVAIVLLVISFRTRRSGFVGPICWGAATAQGLVVTMLESWGGMLWGFFATWGTLLGLAVLEASFAGARWRRRRRERLAANEANPISVSSGGTGPWLDPDLDPESPRRTPGHADRPPPSVPVHEPVGDRDGPLDRDRPAPAAASPA